MPSRLKTPPTLHESRLEIPSMVLNTKIYDALQEKQFSSSNAVDEFVDNAKCSLLFQYSWDESLSAAPLSIHLIGSWLGYGSDIACPYTGILQVSPVCVV